MKAILLSIGDELVLGQTLDTNSQWLAQRLSGVGCDIVEHRTVGDDQPAIELAVAGALGRADTLIITGGLGPTDDDLTRQAIAAVAGVELVLNEAWLAQIEAFFRLRNRPMAERNRIQAMLPAGAAMLDNPNGTACGIALTIPARPPTAGPACRVVAMPGVPKEMKPMFIDHVLPAIAGQSGGAVILQKTLHTFGLGESAVAEKLGTLMDRRRNPSVGTTVSNNAVSLRLNARAPSRQQADDEMAQTAAACRQALGALVYGEDEQTLAGAVAELLSTARATVTTAESCTGGLLAKYLTDVPGSSAYFHAGFVTYSNAMKYERLGVNDHVINTYGAVSEPVVIAMARAARRLAHAHYALSISGIAGPTGGTPSKPVGTVCIALAWGDPKDKDPSAGGAIARTFNFPGDREMIRDRAAKMALTLLRFRLLDLPLPF